MSNYVSITTVAAAAYAAYTGDVRYLAYAALSATGDYMRGHTQMEGPRLSDLSLGSSQYGAPIPWAFGTPRLPGQVWWGSDKRAIANTSGGKGGPQPEITTYTYEVDVLIGLLDCESVALSRVWVNGSVEWTRRDGASDESLVASGGNNLWRRMSFYNGSDTQLPDPVYEAAVGVGQAPAYRGRSYVFIEGLQLGASGQLPQMHFEVVTYGSYSIGTGTVGPVQTMASAAMGAGTAAPISSTTLRVALPLWTSSYSNNQVDIYDLDVLDGTVDYVGNFVVPSSSVANVATGTSDVPCFMHAINYTATMCEVPGGGTTVFNLPVNIGFSTLRYARCLDDVVIGSATFGVGNERRLYRYRGGAYPAATSEPLGQPAASILIIGSAVYVASPSGTAQVYQLDLDTLTLQHTYDAPVADTLPVLVNLGGELGYVDSLYAKLWVLRSAAWVDLGTYPSAFMSGTTPTVTVVGGLLVGGRVASSPDRYETWTAPLKVTPQVQPLADVVDAICTRAGMPAGSWTTTGLADLDGVHAFTISQVMSGRAALQQLAAMRFFDVAPRDKVNFRARGGAVVATVPWADLGAGVDKAADEPFAPVSASDIELPPQLAVTYANVNDDQQLGTEYSDRMVSGQAAVSVMQVALGMTPAEAKGVANAMVADAVVGLVSASFSLPLRYSGLDLGDCISVVDEDGRTYRMRLTRRREAAGVLQFDAVADDASTLPTEGITDSTQAIDNEVSSYSATDLLVLDIPLLRDADDGPGWYWAARGETVTWPGCGVLLSTDGGGTYASAADITESAVLGHATTALAGHDCAVMDSVNVVTVDVGPGVLETSTRDAVLADATVNAIVIGDELLQFVTATQVSAGVYTLSGLVRGRRGTEWAAATHAIGDRVALLRDRGLRRQSVESSVIGLTAYAKGVSYTQQAADVTAQSFVVESISVRPLSPVDLRAARTQAGDMTLTWSRRTRLSATLAGPLSLRAELGESSEAYDVEILDGADVVRTIRATSESASYSADQQISDFGAVQTDVDVRITQIGTYMRGLPLEATTQTGFTPTAQSSTITLGGSFAAGFTLTVYADGVLLASYTTVSGDTDLNGAAASLAAAIDAGTAVYSVSVLGSVVTVTGPVGRSFTLTCSVTGLSDMSQVQVQAAKAKAPARGCEYTVIMSRPDNLEGPPYIMPAGVSLFFEIMRSTATVARTTLVNDFSGEYQAAFFYMMQQLQQQQGFIDAGFSAFQDMRSVDEPLKYRIVGPAGVLGYYPQYTYSPKSWGFLVGTESTGSVAVLADEPEICDITVDGTVAAGEVYSVTLRTGGVATTYTYTAAGGDTPTIVAAALAASIDAAAAYIATSSGPTVRVTGATAAVPFFTTTSITVALTATIA